MVKYSFIKNDDLGHAIVTDLGLDEGKVIARYGSLREFFQRRIHLDIFHQRLDGYGKNTRPYAYVIKGVNALVEYGLELKVVTARTNRLLSIDEHTRNFVDEHFGSSVPIYRVESTKEKTPHLEDIGVWVDDSYHHIVEFLQEKNVYIVRRTMHHNKHLPFHAEISSVHSPKQPWVKSVLDHCEKNSVNSVGIDLDDTVVSFRARVAHAVRLYTLEHADELKELRPQ
jgi:hypothetical protein